MKSSKTTMTKQNQKVQSKVQKCSPSNVKEIKSQKDVGQVVSYDPKNCEKKILEDLIPSKGKKLIYEIDDHHHFVNFYKACKSFIPYYESQINILPNSMNGPYSDFTVFVGKLTKIDNFKNEINQQMKVELYQSESGLKYVLKTCWHRYDPSNQNPALIEFVETFVAKKYNEFVYTKVFSASPHSVKPIDLNFVFLKEEKILISELLETYGGKPITKSFDIPISNSQVIYNIFLQNANALNFTEVLKIAHNDIKGDNILVDDFFGKILLRYIDFDIGQNQSPTVKDSKEIGPCGFSYNYVAPEILTNGMQQNPFLNPGIYSPWKCQIFSLGILMLQLIGFFPKQMNSGELDMYKLSEVEYTKFMTILNEYSQTISDPLMKNILFVIRICLSYQPDDRLSANELIEILQGLESNDEDIINNQYHLIIERRRSLEQASYKLTNVNSKFPSKANEENKNKYIKESAEAVPLEGSKSFSNELNMKQNLLEEILFQQIDLIKLFKTEEKNFNKLKNILNNPKESKLLFANINQEIKTIIQQLQNEVMSLKNMKNSPLEIQLNGPNKNPIQCVESLKCSSTEIENLRLYEKRNNETISKLNELKNRMKKENIGNPNENKSYPDIALFLYEQLIKKTKKEDNASINFRENMHWENNSLFTGQVNELGIPQGVGMLVFKEQDVKVICEFIDGKVKNDMGMLINPQNEYYFGKIKNDICPTTISLTKYKEPKIDDAHVIKIIEKMKQIQGKLKPIDEDYYEGETKNGICEGKGKYYYKCGDYYEGDYKNNLRDGKGEMVYISGNFYVGEFKNDIKHGKGITIYSNGGYYEGEFINNLSEGHGKYVDENGSYYEGDWKKELKDGKGKFVSSKGWNYEGEWKNNLQDGKGKCVYSEGDYYEGYWIKENKEGKGKYVHKGGAYYEGDWKHDFKEGKGKYVYKGGSYYEGDWKNDVEEGKGKYVSEGGVYYEGNWIKGKKEGKGKYIFEGGDYYEGDWKNGVKEGKGKYVYKGGSYYEGDWKNNVEEGKGKYVSEGGAYYEGNWIKGKKEGKGKYIFEGGDYYEGDWKNGVKEGKGKYVHASGAYYEGDWIKGEEEGIGKYVYDSENYYVGEYKSGQKEGKGKLYTVENGKIEKFIEGTWKNGKKEGKFLVSIPNKKSSYIEYKDDNKIN